MKGASQRFEGPSVKHQGFLDVTVVVIALSPAQKGGGDLTLI